MKRSSRLKIGIAAVLGLTVSASAQMMYWTSDSALGIHRAPTAGGPVETLVVEPLHPVGLALDLSANQMYWAQRTGGIRRANLDGSNVQTIVPLAAGQGPRGVALDPIAGKIYWACDPAKVIQRADLSGGNVETLYTASPSAELLGVKLDLAGGKMYWVDAALATISRANLDGSDVEVIVSAGIYTPYYLEIDSQAGHLYWTDYYLANIRRSNLDGSDAVVLVDTWPANPVGIALDPAGGKLYWSLIDGEIQRANLDGSGIEDVVTGLPKAWAVELDLRTAEVPALSSWGAGLLIVGLLATGAVMVRRRTALQ